MRVLPVQQLNATLITLMLVVNRLCAVVQDTAIQANPGFRDKACKSMDTLCGFCLSYMRQANEPYPTEPFWVMAATAIAIAFGSKQSLKVV